MGGKVHLVCERFDPKSAGTPQNVSNAEKGAYRSTAIRQ